MNQNSDIHSLREIPPPGWVFFSLLSVTVFIILFFFLTNYVLNQPVNVFPVSPKILFPGIFPGLLFVLLAYVLLKAKYQVRQLRINVDQLEALLKNLPGMAYRCFNRKGRPFEFVSEGCYALCGYDRRDLEDQRLLWGSAFIHPDEVKFVEDTILAAIDRDEPFTVEYRIITRDGQEKWVWERGQAVAVINGEIVLAGFITDINDRKPTETALVQAEAYSKAVIDTAVEALITIDNHGFIEAINQAAQQMFGYTAENLKGKNILMLIAETDHEQYEQFVTHYLEANESDMVGMGSELTGVRKDKSEFPIHFSMSEVLHQSEPKYIGLIRDLSVPRATEKEVCEQHEQPARVGQLNTLGEMAIVIAHEINQPLTAISMYAKSALSFFDSKNSKPARLREALEKLNIQTHRAGSVIERVQQLSQQQESYSEKVDCNDLIREVYKLAEVEAHIRDIVIKLELSHLLPVVICDPVQIQQVVLNLLRNGMESMKNIGCCNGNCIALRTSRNGFGVKISVIDSGSGISEEIADQLYKPFSTTKDSGMGMGLSISRSIAKVHGGKLEFKNNTNGGVTFYFTLPGTASKKS